MRGPVIVPSLFAALPGAVRCVGPWPGPPPRPGGLVPAGLRLADARGRTLPARAWRGRGLWIDAVRTASGAHLRVRVDARGLILRVDRCAPTR